MTVSESQQRIAELQREIAALEQQLEAGNASIPDEVAIEQRLAAARSVLGREQRRLGGLEAEKVQQAKQERYEALLSLMAQDEQERQEAVRTAASITADLARQVDEAVSAWAATVNAASAAVTRQRSRLNEAERLGAELAGRDIEPLPRAATEDVLGAIRTALEGLESKPAGIPWASRLLAGYGLYGPNPAMTDHADQMMRLRGTGVTPSSAEDAPKGSIWDGWEE